MFRVNPACFHHLHYLVASFYGGFHFTKANSDDHNLDGNRQIQKFKNERNEN
jgi:hypothetical protein